MTDVAVSDLKVIKETECDGHMPYTKKGVLQHLRGKGGAIKLLAMLVAAALALSACSSGSAPSAPAAAQAAEQLVKTVKTMKAAKQPWANHVEQVADVIPSLQLDVVLKVDGDVMQVLKKRGEWVNKDDIILELDKKDVLRQKQKLVYGKSSLESQLSKAKKDVEDSKFELTNNIASTKDALNNLEKDYNTIRNNYDTGQATKKDKEQIENQVNKLQRDLEVLQRKLDTLESSDSLATIQYQLQANEVDMEDVERNLSYFDVKAPASGLLTEMPIEEGMTLPRGQKVGVIQQQNPVKVRAELTEANLQYVRGKKELALYIPDAPSNKLQGKVSYLASTANSQTKTYTLEVEAGNQDGLLKPGMRVQLIIEDGGQQESITVPTSSILQQDGEAYVFVVAAGQAEKRKVKLGRAKDSDQEIVSGLNAGEQVIVTGQHQVQDKEQVKATE